MKKMEGNNITALVISAVMVTTVLAACSIDTDKLSEGISDLGNAFVTEVETEATTEAPKETTVEVTVTLDSSDDELRVGYSAVCTIRLSTDEDVLVLPYDLIRSDEGGDYVFVAEKNKARKRYIKTDKEYKDGIRATEGVSQGDAVINDSEGLYDGQKITIIKRTVQTND